MHRSEDRPQQQHIARRAFAGWATRVTKQFGSLELTGGFYWFFFLGLFFFFLFFFLEFVAYDLPVPDLSKSELCGRQREDWKPKTEGTFRLMPLRYQASLWVICTWPPAW